MWMYNGYGMGTGGWLLMALFWAVLIGLIVFAIVRFVPSHHGPGGERITGEQPLEILKRRLANGDIDADTFEQLRSKLGAGYSAGSR